MNRLMELIRLLADITRPAPPSYKIKEYHPKTYGTTITGRRKR